MVETVFVVVVIVIIIFSAICLALNSSWRFSYTKRWMACLHNIWRMTVSLPLPPADDDFDRPTSPRVRFQELAQVWAIAHSLLLDHVSQTNYLFICWMPNILFWHSASYWLKTHPFCWGQRHLVTVDFWAPCKKFTFTLHCITLQLNPVMKTTNALHFKRIYIHTYIHTYIHLLRGSGLNLQY